VARENGFGVLCRQRQHDKKDARANQRTDSPIRYMHRTMLHAVVMAETPTAVVETFDEIFRDRQLQVLRIAYRIVGNWADAEDIAQEAFVRLHKHMSGLPNAAALGSWLYRVTVNLSLDRTRKVRASEELTELPTGAASAEAELIRRQQQERLMVALSRLPARERAAIVLREIEGLSTAEVAEILGSAEATVRSQVASAVIRLRKMFEQEQGA
jgi:RNA polymerase sigma-70 factor (ECF subfamily)